MPHPMDAAFLMPENDCDAFAAAYDAGNEVNAWNAFNERPAILSMAGDVANLRVLDAGCGGGAHAAALVEQGANLTGIDARVGLSDIARIRLKGCVSLILANLNEPLPLAGEDLEKIANHAFFLGPPWAFPFRRRRIPSVRQGADNA
ncbi:methyltransferase domain-containing protein [Burkholderia seminalis]|uniref:methyltransferase domain-containing protein n=1 Tax=Burkholderia seminalis TaxID=488731 RepID=UPI00264B074F|nr:methyltransferase domain-containing protein [Burkholderia seminalis]MDN7853507.1 methyltransferase domain-containing protein [Burkholderia seminalis]